MRIFLSFNSRDRVLAEGVRAVLRKLRPDVDIFFAPETLGYGAWMPKLAGAIDAADGFLLVIGPDGAGPWQAMEYDAALQRHVREPAFAVVPLITAGGRVPGLPFLRQLNWVELPGPLDDDGLRRAWAALNGESGPADAARWRLVPTEASKR